MVPSEMHLIHNQSWSERVPEDQTVTMIIAIFIDASAGIWVLPADHNFTLK